MDQFIDRCPRAMRAKNALLGREAPAIQLRHTSDAMGSSKLCTTRLAKARLPPLFRSGTST